MRAFVSLAAAGLSLLVLPAVVTAADEPAAKINTKTQAKDDPNRLICRRMEDTGRLAGGRRVCYTKADWDRLAERTRNESMAGAMTGGSSGN